LLALLRDVGIQPKVVGASFVAVIVLGVVSEFHRAALLAVEPKGVPLIVEPKQLTLTDDFRRRQLRFIGRELPEFTVTMTADTGGEEHTEE